MIFYNATSRQGICQEIDRLCSTSDTDYPRLDKTSRVNNALEELVGEIISVDGTWQWDDTNQTDLPRGRGNLVEGQQSYSFTSEYLDVTMIEILNKDGTQYKKIKPIDYSQFDNLSPEQYFGTDSSGNPNKGEVQYYDKIGDTIYLYYAPSSTNHTLTNGIRIWFKRTAVLFSAVATTATDSSEPGLPSPYHLILAYMAAIPYCMTYKQDRVTLYQAKVNEMKKNLLAFYGKREKDTRKVATMKNSSYL